VIEDAPYRLRCETVEFHNCLMTNQELAAELEAERRENARLRERIAELEGNW